jgi:hypothetical protein
VQVNVPLLEDVVAVLMGRPAIVIITLLNKVYILQTQKSGNSGREILSRIAEAS